MSVKKWVLVAQSCLILCDPVDCSSPRSSVHGIFQARILEWVAISSSRGSTWPRDRTLVSCVSCIAGRFFTTEPPGKPLQRGWALSNEQPGHCAVEGDEGNLYSALLILISGDSMNPSLALPPPPWLPPSPPPTSPHTHFWRVWVERELVIGSGPRAGMLLTGKGRDSSWKVWALPRELWRWKLHQSWAHHCLWISHLALFQVRSDQKWWPSVHCFLASSQGQGGLAHAVAAAHPSLRPLDGISCLVPFPPPQV